MVILQISEAYNWHGTTSNKTPKIYDNSHLFMSIHGKVLHISCIYLGLSPNIVAHINYVFSVQSVFPDVPDQHHPTNFFGCGTHVPPEPGGKEGGLEEPRPCPVVLRWDGGRKVCHPTLTSPSQQTLLHVLSI